MPQNLVNEVRNSDFLYRGSMKLDLKLLPLIKSSILVKWCPSHLGWICFNFDDAAKSGLLSKCGGLFRDSQGRWFGGFHKFIGASSNLFAEYWGVLTCLKFTWKKCY